MTNLLLKWLSKNYLNGSARERERETRAQTQAENSDQLLGSIFDPLFQFKVHQTNCEQIALPSSSRACEHVNLIYIYIYIY